MVTPKLTDGSVVSIKKEELVKKFNLDPKLTKDEMCKKILAMK